MKQFEYKTLEFEPHGKLLGDIEADTSGAEVALNQLGAEGWELVNSSGFSMDGTTQKIILFFKREKQ